MNRTYKNPKQALFNALVRAFICTLVSASCIAPNSRSAGTSDRPAKPRTLQHVGSECAPIEPTGTVPTCQNPAPEPEPSPAPITPVESKTPAKSEGSYSRGKKHGKWMYWDDLGNRHRRGHYNRGKRHGQWVAWNSAGDRVAKGHYRNGEKHGQWVYRKNEKMRIVHYREGKRVREAKYIKKMLKRERCWDSAEKRIGCA